MASSSSSRGQPSSRSARGHPRGTFHHQQPQMPYAYPQYPQYNMSSHYAQAYMQYTPTTTPEGYSLSSTYLAQMQTPSYSSTSRWPGYQSGSHRCTKQGCAFTGSQKAVETHMMDRHLIYPPGWDKRKRKSDWDADPSLKGKQIPIQGTSITLDTDEAIDAWIAERKRRFPTADHVADKQRKIEEAVARGQLNLEDTRPNKRRRLDGRDGRDRGRGRGTGRGRGRGRGGAPGERGPNTAAQQPVHTYHALPQKPQPDGIAPQPQADNSADKNIIASSPSESDSDDDAPPEVLSSKTNVATVAVDTTGPTPEIKRNEQGDTLEPPQQSLPVPAPVKKPSARQPKRPPHNPFASRPALLRNLLLPEIRMTVSNLSQAIRFLVDNDFLEGVELRPGESKKMIEVVSESQTGPESAATDDKVAVSQQEWDSDVRHVRP